jgi:cbb3-type cytochrome oxidase subunit 1
VGIRFIKIAVIYLFVGALLGGYMGATENFVLAPVHAHLALLGWASLALAGLIYHLYPAAALTLLARIHFWLHNIGLPFFMLGLCLVLTGHAAAVPIVSISAASVIIGLAAFTANVLMNVKVAAGLGNIRSTRP